MIWIIVGVSIAVGIIVVGIVVVGVIVMEIIFAEIIEVAITVVGIFVAGIIVVWKSLLPGFSWIFMDFHGFSWIFMDFHGFSWIFIGFGHPRRPGHRGTPAAGSRRMAAGSRRMAAGWPDTVWGGCLAGWGAGGVYRLSENPFQATLCLGKNKYCK